MKHEDFNFHQHGFVGHLAEPDAGSDRAVIVIMGGNRAFCPVLNSLNDLLIMELWVWPCPCSELTEYRMLQIKSRWICFFLLSAISGAKSI